ncbi:MAG TPA: TIGR03016 family PEP-CTERM system-associated outer membrane protein [Accumulibacter sp.]|uniref:TIGR03016 family PEP-CTERM system-associated outer membrane protein n=1 Tax=Accumulibacter sp. TaxID=2053492 RepID=UPI0025D20026|nr:TIGR03016 family PEP-CTERM system-associated outer membrane protein [Accumulibacter sp.]MCM8600502.1 TIGR03016 family PEP-CTERM system-associated outer membrane protein [Accumulibacter sp.]HNC51656.1 TIGR03016 family PEP-CTERM system-associated outer membrane protein [Accumulibacter sp.]
MFFTAAPVCADNWRITPSIALTETWTDNVFLTARNTKSDLVTGITPGIAIDGKGHRASLRLNYTFTEQLYSPNYANIERLTGQTSASNNHQNALNAVGKLEAIENWMFIDATGTISQQYLSAFGAVSPSTANVNRNQTETSNYSISPYIKGTLLSSTEYLVRYRAAITNTTASGVQSNQGDLTSSEWTGRLNGTTRWGALGWALDASSLRNNYTVGRDYEDSKYQASLSYRFEPQFRVSAFAGQESNNYVSLQNETHAIYGGTVMWTPDPRTEISASDGKRFFGNGYDVTVRHQMARALFTYTASRNVVFQPYGVGNTGQGINYDAFYAIIAANNPGASPDAIRSQVLQVLQGRGVAADATVVNGYLTNRPNLQQMQQFSFALLGVRNTLTLNANETKQQPLGVVNGVTNDYSLANQTTQRGFGIAWGHKLTGLSSLSLSLNQMRSISQSVGQLDTKTQGAYLLFTTSLSPKAQANIGARRVVSDGGAISSPGLGSSYTENALTGALSYSF